MDTNLLQQILDRANSKFETSIQMNSTSSIITVNFPNKLNLKPELSYKVGVTLFSVFNLPKIVNENNNQLRYSKDNGVTWKTVSLSPGAYQYSDLNPEIQTKLTANSDWTTDAIVIGVDLPSGKFTVKLLANYQIDFNIPNSIRTILGFDARIISTVGINLGDKIGNIEGGISTINIKSDLSNGGYIADDNNNLIQRGILFTIPFLSVGMGSKIIEAPTNPIYYSVNQTSISSINLSVVDENNRIIDFGGQTITIILHLKQV